MLYSPTSAAGPPEINNPQTGWASGSYSWQIFFSGFLKQIANHKALADVKVSERVKMDTSWLAQILMRTGVQVPPTDDLLYVKQALLPPDHDT